MDDNYKWERRDSRLCDINKIIFHSSQEHCFESDCGDLTFYYPCGS